MKKHLTSVLRQISFGGLFMLAAMTIKAQSVLSDSTSKDDLNTVRYLGTQDDMMVFNISYSNPQGVPFLLIVKDQDGAELYHNAYKDKNFYKQFRLAKTDRSRLTFVIRSKEAEMVKNFAINVNSRIVQDVAIKKLD